ncbi:MAG: adenosylcobinamide-GDP ribazoletransferase [Thermoplasmata archaeon]|nr:adenosylcobinamide-GDP ribazoletransferase [Thermoplasmata archaeon]
MVPSDSNENERYGVFSALKGMFSFFTILPINIEMKEINAMNRKFWLVPVVGLFFGLLASFLMWGFMELSSSMMLSAAVTLFAMMFVNRYLHLDGLLDVGDGLTAVGSQEKHLKALKDSTIGSGAFATGLFVYLITFSAMCNLYAGVPIVVAFFTLFAMSEVLCRNGQVFAAAFGIPSNGMAGDSVRATGMKEALKSLLLSLVLIALLEVSVCAILGFDAYDYTYVPVCALVGTLASCIWGWALSSKANRTFGAVNGDILGAVNESTRAIILVAFVIVLAVMI